MARPGKGKGRRGEHRPPRPGPPPAATGDEASYIKRLKETATPLIVHLKDGRVVRGHIEYFDREVVKITCEREPHLLIRKEQIRYWVEA